MTRPWKALFVTTDDDIQAWWYRWKLDRYCALAGMALAAGIQLAQRAGFLDDNTHGNLFSNGIALSATLVGLIGFGSYGTFTALCRDREDCDEIHAYAACVPVIFFFFHSFSCKLNRFLGYKLHHFTKYFWRFADACFYTVRLAGKDLTRAVRCATAYLARCGFGRRSSPSS